MPKRIYVLFFLAAAFGVLFYATPTRSASTGPLDDDDLAAFKDNTCVVCHSTDLAASSVSNRYLEWHISTHKLTGVSCEKCHGGDPTTRDKKKSHEGMLPSSDAKSKTNPKNLPATCATCHPQESAAFTGSKHFQSVQAAGGGPSCVVCHEHMVSSVITTASEGAALCAKCHTAGGATLASKHPEVPAKAEELMAAIERADGMVIWANGLLEAAKDRKLDVAADEKEMQAVIATLKEAKANWHSFSLVGVREKADQAFERGTKAKDALRKKMGYN